LAPWQISRWLICNVDIITRGLMVGDRRPRSPGQTGSAEYTHAQDHRRHDEPRSRSVQHLACSWRRHHVMQRLPRQRRHDQCHARHRGCQTPGCASLPVERRQGNARRRWATGPSDLHHDPPAVVPERAEEDRDRVPGQRQVRHPGYRAADGPPFFHNNAVAKLEEAVAFYTTDTFNSPVALARRSFSTRTRLTPLVPSCGR